MKMILINTIDIDEVCTLLMQKAYTVSDTLNMDGTMITIQIQGRTNRRNTAKTSVDRITRILSYLQ